MRRIVLLVIVLALVAGCSRGGQAIELGIKRVALSLSFADEDKAEPAETRVVYQLIPAPPALVSASPATPPLVLPPFELPAFIACPSAPEGASPKQAVLRLATQPPAAGIYPRRNTGTIHVEGALVPIDLPYPPFSLWEFGESKQIEVAGDPTGSTAPMVQDEYTVKKSLTPDFFVIETLRRTPTGIALVKRETTANGTTTTLTPSPPVTVYSFGVENEEWRSAGVDQETSTAMLVTGKVVKREVIDVCGELIDTYQATFTEEVVNLDTGDVSGSNPGEPNTINVAPQLGALVIREDIHATARTRDAENGAPLTIQLDYVSTTSSVEPVPRGLL